MSLFPFLFAESIEQLTVWDWWLYLEMFLLYMFFSIYKIYLLSVIFPMISYGIFDVISSYRILCSIIYSLKIITLNHCK